MLIKKATTQECELLFRRELERRGQRFDHYKKKWNSPRAAVSIAQAKASQTGGNLSTTSITTVAGNLLVVVSYQGIDNTTALAITDSGGANTWTQVGGYGSASAVSRLGMFYCANAASVTSVTATWGSISGTVAAVVYEIRGILKASPLDLNASNGGVTSASATGTSLLSAALSTNNSIGVILYAVGEGANSTGWAGTNSFAFPAGSFLSSGGRVGVGNLIVNAVQSSLTTTSSWTTTGVDRIGLIAAFMGDYVGPELTPGPGKQAMDLKYAVPY